MNANEKSWNEEEEVIDLRDLFFALKRKIVLILAVSLIGGCLSGVFTAFSLNLSIHRLQVCWYYRKKQL